MVSTVRSQEPTKRERAANFAAEHPLLDLAGVATLLLLYVVFTKSLPRSSLLFTADYAQRQLVYGAGAGVLSLIAGFTGSAIGQYASATSSLVTALRESHGDAIRKNWLSILRSLLLCAVTCLICLALNSPTAGPRFSDILFVGALTFAITKFVRLSLIYGMLLVAVDRQTSSSRPAPPAVNSRAKAS